MACQYPLYPDEVEHILEHVMNEVGLLFQQDPSNQEEFCMISESLDAVRRLRVTTPLCPSKEGHSLADFHGFSITCCRPVPGKPS